MMKNRVRACGAFSVTETVLLILVAVLLAGVAVPRFLQAQKRSEAREILEDLQAIDSAIDQYAIQSGLAPGSPVPWTKVQYYLRPDSRAATNPVNRIGGDYSATPYSVDGPVPTPVGTKAALGGVVAEEFWKPYELR